MSTIDNERGTRKEALRRMLKLVNSLLARADSGPFREPVDWRALELYDYPQLIKKMMDLGTVKRKLERQQYTTAEECADDIRLIWSNCKTYNADGSDFFLLAESFSKRFEDRYRKIRSECDTGDQKLGPPSAVAASSVGSTSTSTKKDSIGTEPPSLQRRTQFGANLFYLSGMELGHVIKQLELKCPKSLQSPPAGVTSQEHEQLEIDVDQIDPKTFAELDRYLKETLGAVYVEAMSPNLPGGSGESSSNKKRRRS